MRIAAYQFEVTSDITVNLNKVLSAIENASQNNVELLVFPECALTGYPPITIPDSNVDLVSVKSALEVVQQCVDDTGIYCLLGTIDGEGERRYNRSYLFSPNDKIQYYDKSALGGWDSDNFIHDDKSGNGIFNVKNLRIGIRICFEVRFPELFRFLYEEKCDLMVVQFFDISDYDNKEYYDIILGHLRTRAAENVCPLLSVNSIKPYQEAPTALFNCDGFILKQVERNIEDMLIYDYYGREISDSGKRRKVWIDNVIKYQ